MRKGAWKHKLPTQARGQFTRRRRLQYHPSPRPLDRLPGWNQDKKTRQEWRLNYPRGRGLFTAREDQQAINKYFRSRTSRSSNRWAEKFLWR